MNSYQKEQFEAFSMVDGTIRDLSGKEISALDVEIKNYIEFRKDVDNFVNKWFKDVCSVACFKSRKSACCSREGIVTFFADVFINVLTSRPGETEKIMDVLKNENTGLKCIYLGEAGCIWRIKPIVCQMFLCDRAKEKVFQKRRDLAAHWDRLKQREKAFTWPDRPVLFDDIESLFLSKGLSSPLMYLHNSPGLVKIKRDAGMPDPQCAIRPRG